jgi:hypothetical protein
MITLLADGREEKIPDLTIPAGSAVLGWERKPQGWCRGDACVPGALAAAAETPDGTSIEAFAALLGREVVVDAAEGVVAVGEPVTALATGEAPDFTLGGFTLSSRRG